MDKRIIYYEDSKGAKPAKQFINKLDVNLRGKILARLTFLGKHWRELRRPFVDYLGGKLYELRIRLASGNVRIIYAYMFHDYIVLLHGMVKKSQKIPENDKLTAKKRKIDFQIRHDKGKIKLK
jgi:phage-related protein